MKEIHWIHAPCVTPHNLMPRQTAIEAYTRLPSVEHPDVRAHQLGRGRDSSLQPYDQRADAILYTIQPAGRKNAHLDRQHPTKLFKLAPQQHPRKLKAGFHVR